MVFLHIFCLCTVVLVVQYLRTRNAAGPLPPGPGLIQLLYEWIQGQKDIAHAFEGWNKEYGPVVYARVGAQTFIILGTRQAAQDLLERRAAIYSSRGPSVFLDKYLHRGLASAFMPYGSQWRLHRRLQSSFVNVRLSKTYQGLQDVTSKLLMRNLLSCNNYPHLFYQYTSSMMFALAYGNMISETSRGCSENDSHRHGRLHRINEMATFILQNASGGTILLDLFPFLDLLPEQIFMRWRARARELHEQTRKVYIECADSALASNGCWNWSVEANTQKAKQEGTVLPWVDICYSIGELYVAGIHTTKMVLELFVKACTENPDAMERAQKELDSVVGAKRLPSFSDMDNLPYIRAFISELLRRWPISPLGVPHMVIQDDEYMGYKIPAGSIVVANQLRMNMDDTIFHDPGVFNPDRYIKSPDLPPPSTFGFGRRQCPGHHIARASIFIVISRILWGYNIQTETPGKNIGHDSPPENVQIRSRGSEYQRTIETECARAKEDEKAYFEKLQAAVQSKKA